MTLAAFAIVDRLIVDRETSMLDYLDIFGGIGLPIIKTRIAREAIVD